VPFLRSSTGPARAGEDVGFQAQKVAQNATPPRWITLLELLVLGLLCGAAWYWALLDTVPDIALRLGHIEARLNLVFHFAVVAMCALRMLRLVVRLVVGTRLRMTKVNNLDGRKAVLPPLDAPAEDLEKVESQIQDALERGDDGCPFPVLGFGEVSVVFKAKLGDREFAVKRLSASYPSGRLVGAYEKIVNEYMEKLRARRLVLPDTYFEVLGSAESGYVCYLVQDMVPAERLLTSYMHRASEKEAVIMFKRMCEKILFVISFEVGLDSQLSNWYLTEDGELGYFDVSTPFLRAMNGQQRLDVSAFLATMPFGIRQLVATFLIDDVLGQYHSPRTAVLDLIGNLEKERLSHLIPVFIRVANDTFGEHLGPPYTAEEVRKYYASDSTMYAVLQTFRRWQRFLQMSVLGQLYPYLLPPPIDR